MTEIDEPTPDETTPDGPLPDPIPGVGEDTEELEPETDEEDEEES